MFTILIPTWNNLPLLKLCVESIHHHSAYTHQIILHVNDGNDGTIEWAKQQNLDFTQSADNIGICRAINLAAGLAKYNFILYLNDDMYMLPNWDTVLTAEIQKTKSSKWMFSATMIEPAGINDCNILADYGRTPETFERERLLREYATLQKENWLGASWPPLIMPRALWEEVGGFSIEFSPGMYSDPDLSMKLWAVGCRTFKGLGASRVYHFQGRSTGRVKKNNGRIQFMKKWGISAAVFYKHFLKLGQPAIENVLLEDPKQDFFWERLKAKFYALIK
jgi:GT2 family glycosyltransferase